MLAFSECWVMLMTGTGPPPAPPPLANLIRELFFPVYAVSLVLAVSRIDRLGAAMLHAPALVLLLVVVVASIAWSIDPAITTRRCIAIGFTTLTAVVLAERYEWPRFLEVYATALGIAVVLSFVLALAFPAYGIMQVDFPGAWRGAWSHKNNLGYYMSVALMVFVASAIANPGRRWLWTAGAVASVILIVLSDSKTSWVAGLIGAMCMPLMALGRRGPAWAVASTYLWVSALAGIALTLYLAPDLLLGLLGKDETLTGRTAIWAAVMRQIAERPLTGFGYGAVWDSTSAWGPLAWISRQQGFVVHEAHNTWLGVWLELGVVGLAAWTLLFVGVWARALTTFYVPGSTYFAVPFLAVFSLHTVTESVALSQNDLIWLTFVATAVKLAQPSSGPAYDWPARRSGLAVRP